MNNPSEETIKKFVSELTGEAPEDIDIVSITSTELPEGEKCPICGEVHGPDASEDTPMSEGEQNERAGRNRAKVLEIATGYVEKMERILPEMQALVASLKRPMAELSKEEGFAEMKMTLTLLMALANNKQRGL